MKIDQWQYPDGSVYFGETDCENGHRHGIGTYFDHATGRISIGYWRHNKRSGITLSVYPNGYINCSLFSGDEGIREGSCLVYFPNGIKQQCRYVNGRQEGACVVTCPDGTWYRGEFQDGLTHGVVCHYDKDDNVTDQEEYCGGKKLEELYDEFGVADAGAALSSSTGSTAAASDEEGFDFSDGYAANAAAIDDEGEGNAGQNFAQINALTPILLSTSKKVQFCRVI